MSNISVSDADKLWNEQRYSESASAYSKAASAYFQEFQSKEDEIIDTQSGSRYLYCTFMSILSATASDDSAPVLDEIHSLSDIERSVKECETLPRISKGGVSELVGDIKAVSGSGDWENNYWECIYFYRDLGYDWNYADDFMENSIRATERLFSVVEHNVPEYIEIRFMHVGRVRYKISVMESILRELKKD